MEVVDISRLYKPENKRIRFAAYCRVSTDSEDQLNSFAAQVKRYMAFEKTHQGYELVDIYADEGISGTSMENRSELQRLIGDCEKGKIDTILVKSVSRLARNTEDLLDMIRKFKSFGVNLYFEEEMIDTDTMNSELTITIKGMAAQQESVSISKNVRWSYKSRMESGEFSCTMAPYGYKLVDNKLVIVEDEAEIVRRIFNMYLSGVGLVDIANILNSEKIDGKRSGCVWRKAGIEYILKNEKYIGDSLLQKKYTPETLPFKNIVNNGNVPQYYVQNSHEPIIDRETYRLVQERFEFLRQSDSPCDNSKVVFHRIVFCDKCGRRYKRIDSNGKKYWVCNGTTDEIHHCSGSRIREEALYDTYKKMMYKLSENKEIITTMIKQITGVQRKVGGSRERIRQIDVEIANLSEQNTRIALFNVKKVMKDSEYLARKSEIEGKINALRQERKKLVCTDKNEEYIEEITELIGYLDKFSLEDDFDEDLFLSAVKSINVINNNELEFRLIGEIKLTEEIAERLRCNKDG